MEDAHVAVPELATKSEGPVSLFGVFDGHGGRVFGSISKQRMIISTLCFD